ncbi:MAG TPA: hypothetical protein VH684_25540 [Xanthobacteraceae bacterium]|jgi:hypothetical protein
MILNGAATISIGTAHEMRRWALCQTALIQECGARLPDGRLTDMVNRTRAKDAAVSIALGMLNNGLLLAA